MADSPDDAWTTVFCQRPYNSYRAYGGRNPAFKSSPGLDGRLLDFKVGDNDAIKSETTVLLNAIEKLDLLDAVVAIIPGHEAAASNRETPLARAAEAIAAASDYTAAPDSLVRTRSIDKLADGGDRSVNTHVTSMAIPDPTIVRGQTVVIIDDIVTTGNSIAAARQLLLIRLVQHATICSVRGCALRFQRICASSSGNSPVTRPVKTTWRRVVGRKASHVLVAGTGGPIGC